MDDKSIKIFLWMICITISQGLMIKSAYLIECCTLVAEHFSCNIFPQCILTKERSIQIEIAIIEIEIELLIFSQIGSTQK